MATSDDLKKASADNGHACRKLVQVLLNGYGELIAEVLCPPPRRGLGGKPEGPDGHEREVRARPGP